MFQSTMRKLDKDFLKRDQYKEVHLSEVANNFIEPVPLGELEDPNIKMHFLHHFPVYKKDTTSTTPSRRVERTFFNT